MIVEVNGKPYISVKGTAKAYDNRHVDTIHSHIRKNPKIFNDYVIDLKEITTRKKMSGDSIKKSEI